MKTQKDSHVRSENLVTFLSRDCVKLFACISMPVAAVVEGVTNILSAILIKNKNDTVSLFGSRLASDGCFIKSLVSASNADAID